MPDYIFDKQLHVLYFLWITERGLHRKRHLWGFFSINQVKIFLNSTSFLPDIPLCHIWTQISHRPPTHGQHQSLSACTQSVHPHPLASWYCRVWCLGAPPHSLAGGSFLELYMTKWEKNKLWGELHLSTVMPLKRCMTCNGVETNWTT